MASKTTIGLCLTLAGAAFAAGFWSVASDTPADHAAGSHDAQRAKGGSATPVPALEHPAADDATIEWTGALHVEAPPRILDEVRRMGAASPGLAALPEPDRAWVLARASMAFTVGQTSRESIPQHIEELASIRHFAVLEREAPYVTPEDPSSSPEKHDPEAH